MSVRRSKAESPWPMRVGIGFDLHRLRRGRPFVLAGIRLPSPAGPEGHYDADPLAHAVVDALLGAAALGDIGEHFPDTDPRWKGTLGAEFLERTRALLARHGWQPCQVDATVFCERPKLGQHKRRIAGALARALGIPESDMSLKAKTMEGLGPIGSGKAVAAQAVATLTRLPRRASRRRSG